MAREKEFFRENLQILNEAFPSKFAISTKELKAWLGIKDSRTLRKRFKYQGNFITKTQLARDLCL